jgi:hypothetical protein
VRYAGVLRSFAVAHGALLVFGPLAATADHHEGKEAAAEQAAEATPSVEWNQARMTELSAELASSMAQIRSAFRKEPVFRNPQSTNQRAVHNMDQTLRNLETATRRLSSLTKGGGDLEKTRGTARRIGMLLNDADMWGRRIMTSVWMEERVQPAMKLINEIAPYYGSGPLYDPETMQRLDRAPDPQARPNPCNPEGS